MRLFPLSILNLLRGPPRILRRCATESGNLQDRAGQAEVRAAVAEAQLIERDTITVEQKSEEQCGARAPPWILNLDSLFDIAESKGLEQAET